MEWDTPAAATIAGGMGDTLDDVGDRGVPQAEGAAGSGEPLFATATHRPPASAVEARVIDLDGVYDPCRPNDRLLLGMKGSISELELGVLRARMLDAARAKARRGELRISVPVGYIWHREIGLGFDPDLRIQEAIRVIFAKFRELGSARQVLLAMTADQVHFPRLWLPKTSSGTN
jgi:DNA invertase Pin-like site-specific DNA recombinase